MGFFYDNNNIWMGVACKNWLADEKVQSTDLGEQRG